MGEVYKARDSRLQRNVAIKILPATFATDPARLARFEREAHVLAALNHPHIAQIYGVEESPGVLALVMELVDGETLADMLRAPAGLQKDDALDIARQIADALETAHEQGIVHRDLKPANVKVRPDGTVKVLDFGLAKAMSGDASAAAASLDNSPTVTSPAVTQIGVILGTAAYMAPEQARGKAVDRRTDIWAFGCLLYEMLTGARPFDGETVTDVISAIVSREPDWNALPAHVPESVAQLVRRCLQKDPRKRLRDIGEARIVLEAPGAPVPVPTVPKETTTGRTQSLAWTISAVAAAIAIAALVWAYGSVQRQTARSNAPATVTRFDVQAPDAASALTLVFRPAIALSANGRALAFVAAAAGVEHIYVRTRSDPSVWTVPGSARGTTPALSPDGTAIAFFASGQIWKAPIGGEPTAVGAASDVRGLSWTEDGRVVLTPGAAAPLMIMPAGGGEMRPLTKMAPGERTHRWPQALPGGKAVLFTVGTLASPDSYDKSNIEGVITATGERRVIVAGSAMARYCGDGRLLFTRGAALYSIAFDPGRLTSSGDPVQVVPAVARDPSTGAAHFSCASDGTLAYVPATSLSEQRQLFWVGDAQRMESVKLPPGPFQEARISPDGGQAVLLNGTSLNGDVWVLEFASGTFRRLTFTSTNVAPIWSADGQTVYFTSFNPARNSSTLMKKPADGSREAVAVATVDGRGYVAWVDANETSAILDVTDPAIDRGDIVRLSFVSPQPMRKLIETATNEFGSAVSPNGQWLAYESDETGRPEVHVFDLSGTRARWQVTTEGGNEPHWSSDGRQLFYRSSNRLMAVPLEPGKTFRYGKPRPLFDGIYNSGIESGRSYDVDPKTGRFLLVRPADDGPSPRSVRVVLNWPVELAGK
jgi:Tol biopolymer transport system component